MKPKLKFGLKIASVIILLAAGGYYISKMRSGGEMAVSFVSLTYKWGVGDTLQNVYNSKTGDYQFLDTRDQLIKENFLLRTNNVIYLHSKINEGDLLNLPDTIANPNANLKDSTVLRYEFEFVHEKHKKHIVYLTNYDVDPMIATKASQLQKLVQQTVTEAQERYARSIK